MSNLLFHFTHTPEQSIKEEKDRIEDKFMAKYNNKLNRLSN
jgi:hypothetical protein